MGEGVKEENKRVPGRKKKRGEGGKGKGGKGRGGGRVGKEEKEERQWKKGCRVKTRKGEKGKDA